MYAIRSYYDDQRFPKVVYNSRDNEFLVVWHHRQTGNYRVYGQRVSSTGGLLGPRIAVPGGYHSAVEARMDFDQLLEGDDSWQARTRPIDREEGPNDWRPRSGRITSYNVCYTKLLRVNANT